jgi:hypothetical protein
MTGQLRQVGSTLHILTGHLKKWPRLPDILMLSALYSGAERALIDRILGLP